MNSNNFTDPSQWLQATSHPGSLWGKTNVVCDCCYIILLFDVLFLFVLESKECSLVVHWTIVTQTHTTWFQHCCFPVQKARMYGTEIDLSWTDHWLVRCRSANLRFMPCLCVVSPRSKFQGLFCTLKSYTEYSRTYTYVDFQGRHGKDEEEGFQNFSVKNKLIFPVKMGRFGAFSIVKRQ